ncbi:amidohydrolase [Micromonospora sp. CPCC 205371]|nr:amidohydrolase [Micromonospora sp. CPCC 205371]
MVDHHVHGARRDDLTRAEFEDAITESDRPVPSWMSTFDSPLGFAIRRCCAPLLDLRPHADPGDYVARRRDLGAAEVNRRFLAASGVRHFLVETGFRAAELLDPAGMAEASGAVAGEVVRLESVAEELTDVAAADFSIRYAERLTERTMAAPAARPVVAYRSGLASDPPRPRGPEAPEAAARWLGAGGGRLSDPVLLRHVIWAGVDRGLPLQIHTGFGDPDLRLHRADPLLLTRFLELVEPHGVPVLLLHCYPFHRHAAYLAQAYPHVHFDVGLALNYVGAAATAVLAEALELAPFAKMLYSSDAFGPAELHYLGAELWRRALSAVLGERVASGEWSAADAQRVAEMIGYGNARRVYDLG